MKRPKRIAILADFPWRYFDEGATGRGGGQACTWLSQLAEEFARCSAYEIHWLSIDRRSILAGSETRDWGGQFFHRVPGLKMTVDLRMGCLLSRWQLLRELRRIDPDLVHCWGTETPYPLVAGRCAPPVVLSMQGVLGNLQKQGFLPDHWYWNKISALEEGSLRKANLITCESQWAIDRVLEIVPHAVTSQVEYGVNPGFYETTWEPNRENPYVLFVGTLAGYKGVEILLDAIRHIGDRTWTMRFAGDGPLREAVLNCGIPKVEWLGVLPWVELQQQMSKAICLVHPTMADSSPNVVKEARVIGLPVITTVHGGQAGYIRDGENGLLVEPLEAGSLADALSRLMNDHLLAQRMGACRHAEDRAYFRASRTASGFIQIYDEMIRGASHRPL